MTARDNVVERFKIAVTSSLKNHDELVLALFGKKRQASLETVLVEQFVLSTTVTWESFLNDLFVAYIEMKPKICLDSLEKRIEDSIKTKFGKTVARLIKFNRPTELTPSKIAALVDPDGRNLSLSSASKIASRANEMLASEFARRFALDEADGAFVDFSVALRNYLGHESKKARTSLSEAHVRLSDQKNEAFLAPISNLGKFLKEKDAAGYSRAKRHALRLVEIASVL